VTTRTKTELLTPPHALLQPCTKPSLRRTVLVRDVTANNTTLQTALDGCIARLDCLVWWWQSAAKVPATAKCESEH
jgi:hypothetical protein